MKNINFKSSEGNEGEESESSTISLSDEEVTCGQSANVPEETESEGNENNENPE
jgi:hypothetical protein